MDVVNTICQSCYFYCGLRVSRDSDRIVRIEGLREHPVNRGTICPKGLAAQQLVTDPNRLKSPLRRVGPRGSGEWEKVTWDEALDLLASKMSAARDEFGPEAVVYHRGHAPGWVTTMNYVSRFMNAFGSPNVLTHAHLCFAPRAIAHTATYGGVPEPDFDRADCILLWGFNPVYTSLPNYARRIIEAKARGAKLIVVDPRFTPTAAKADLWLRPEPGTDLALAMGMVKILIDEGLYHADFVREYTVGFDQLAAHVEGIDLREATAITRIPMEEILQAARMIGGGRPTVVKEGNGLDQHVNVVQTVRAVAILSALTGGINIEGGGILLPPLPFADVQLRGARGDDWEERSLSTHPLYYRTGNSLHDEEMFSVLEDGDPHRVRVLFVQGGSLVAANSNTARTRRLLGKVDFIAVHDLYETATAQIADLVLPAASFLERDLLLYYRYRPTARMNMIALQQQVVPPIGESRSDLDLIFDLARRLGLGDRFPWATTEEAFDWELEPVGISLDYLRRHPEGYQREYEPGELYWTDGRTKFETASGKVELYSRHLEAFGADPLPQHESVPALLLSSGEYPLLCGTGLKLGIHTHTEFRTLPWIDEIEPAPFVEVHPQKAADLRIHDGDPVSVESAWGSVPAVARLTEGVAEGAVMLAYGYGQPYADRSWRSSNDLTPDASVASDPISGATSNRRVPVRIVRSNGTGESRPRERRFLLESMDRCVGCHTCEVACQQEHGEKRLRLVDVGPASDDEGTMRMESIVLGTEKCDLCTSRAGRGLPPACVVACPTRALIVIDSQRALRLLQAGGHQVCASRSMESMADRRPQEEQRVDSRE